MTKWTQEPVKTIVEEHHVLLCILYHLAAEPVPCEVKYIHSLRTMKHEKMVLSPIKTVIEHLSIYEKMHAVYESGREMAILWI